VDESVTIAFVGYATAAQEPSAVAYEDAVLPLLTDHGATLVYRGRRAKGQRPSLPLEVHLIRFPSRVAYERFLVDDRRQHLLEVHGEVFTSEVVVELDTIAGAAG